MYERAGYRFKPWSMFQISLFFFSIALPLQEYELENPSYYKDSDTAGEQDPSWFQSDSSWLQVDHVYNA